MWPYHPLSVLAITTFWVHHFLCNQCRTPFSSLIEILRSEFGNGAGCSVLILWRKTPVSAGLCRISSQPWKQQPANSAPATQVQMAGETLKYRMHKMNIRKIKRSKSSTPRQPKCRLVVFVYVCGLSHRHLGLPKPLEIYFQVTFYLSWYLCVWIRLILYLCHSFKPPSPPLRLTTFPFSRKTESSQLFNEWMMVFDEAFLTSHSSWRLAFDCQKYMGRQADFEDFNQQREHRGITKWWIYSIYIVNLYF